MARFAKWALYNSVRRFQKNNDPQSDDGRRRPVGLRSMPKPTACVCRNGGACQVTGSKRLGVCVIAQAERKPAQMYRCRITVLARPTAPCAAKDDHCFQLASCLHLQAGQTFFAEEWSVRPEELCPSAWLDIRRYVGAIMSNGTTSTAIVCCTGGFRSAVFKLERAEEEPTGEI